MRWQQQNNSSLELFCVLGCVSAREGDRQLRQDGQIELLLVKWHPAKLREKTDDGHIIMRSVCPPHPFPSFYPVQKKANR
jgi:hypothetical protein